jgi:hypothetical protein
MISITKSLFRTINKGAHFKLLSILILFSLMLLSSAASAQKTWDFGNNTTVWTTTAVTNSTTFNATIDGLTVVAGGGALAPITSGAVTFSSAAFGSNSYTGVNRLGTGGASSNTPLPTKRYLSFPVTGSCSIKLWLGATATGRTTYVSNGTTV